MYNVIITYRDVDGKVRVDNYANVVKIEIYNNIATIHYHTTYLETVYNDIIIVQVIRKELL